jgi:hypothetical protein
MIKYKLLNRVLSTINKENMQVSVKREFAILDSELDEWIFSRFWRNCDIILLAFHCYSP